MKNVHYLLFAFMLFALSSCSVITGIFKAGAITGIIAVVVVIAIIIWIFSMFRGKN
ncbi:phosphatidate cytidylyltransferase [Mucilaginibacter sp. CAU 1740]|uniref:phosphatidate cytidylyltransferase n=1 Tax=Mucilaginibacter sp. CAU 1740 TaxID=3140365 RepID=UPI00325AFFF3